MTRLNWGMVGGGDGSQIGPAHRLGAGLDGAFSFVAGALDHNPEGALLHKAWALQRTGPMGIGVKCWLARPNAVTGLIW